jgi:hypothetical protein
LFDVTNLNLFISIENIIAEAHEKTFGDTEILMKGIDLKNEYPDIPWDQFALTALILHLLILMNSNFSFIVKLGLRILISGLRRGQLIIGVSY